MVILIIAALASVLRGHESARDVALMALAYIGVSALLGLCGLALSALMKGVA